MVDVCLNKKVELSDCCMVEFSGNRATGKTSGAMTFCTAIAGREDFETFPLTQKQIDTLPVKDFSYIFACILVRRYGRTFKYIIIDEE